MIYALLLVAALTPAQVDSAITGAEKAFSNYVFPDVAERAVAKLKDRASAYRQISDPDALIKAVNDDLYSVTHDKHVRLSQAEPPDEGGPQATAAQQHRFEQFENYAFFTLKRLPGNVGYIDFGGFSGDSGVNRAINAAMAFLSDTDALIIDLRQNGGGNPRAAQALEGYFFDQPQQITSLIMRDPKTGNTSEFQQFTAPYEPGPLYLNKPVYLLTSKDTFSCAEQFTYDLKSLKRVTIVGETTGGGANPGRPDRVGDNFQIFIPRGYAHNPITKSNWEGTGIAPDVPTAAADALVKAYGLAATELKAKATDPDIAAALGRVVADPAKMLTVIP